MIEGVLLTPLNKISHPKGDIFHVIKKSSEGYQGFGEVYISTIVRNEVKGWKKHHEMTLNLIVPSGEIKIVIFDDRKDSRTYNKFQEVVLSLKNYCRLTVPRELWVAFQGKGDSLNMLINVASIEHNPDESGSIDLNEIDYSWDSA